MHTINELLQQGGDSLPLNLPIGAIKPESISSLENPDNYVLTLVSGIATWRQAQGDGTFSGILGVSQGGTGLTSLIAGDILYAMTPLQFTRLPIGSANTFLTSNGLIPEYRTIVASDINSLSPNFVALQVGGVTVSLVGHIHDDRYYTETEVDSLLANKSDVGHAHTAADITSGTFPGAGQYRFSTSIYADSFIGTLNSIVFDTTGTGTLASTLGHLRLQTTGIHEIRFATQNVHTSSIDINGNFVPVTDLTVDIGTTLLRFANVRAVNLIAATSITQGGTAVSLVGHTHAETDITDGSILARLAANETISGAWTFSNNVIIRHTNANQLEVGRDTSKFLKVDISSSGEVTLNADSDSVPGLHLALGGTAQISLATASLFLNKEVVRFGESAALARLRLRGFYTASPSDPPTDQTDIILVDNGVSPVLRVRYNDGGTMKVGDLALV